MLDIVFADLANYHRTLLEQSVRTHHSQTNLSQSNLSQPNLVELSQQMQGLGGGSTGGQWQQGQWLNQDNETDLQTQRVGSTISSSSSSSSGSSNVAAMGPSDSTTAQQASVASFATPLKPSRSTSRDFSVHMSTTGGSSSRAGQSMNETRITQTQSIGGARGLSSMVTVGRMSHLKVTVIVIVIVRGLGTVIEQ